MRVFTLEKKISEGEKETEMMGDTCRGKKLFCNLLKEKGNEFSINFPYSKNGN
jgi:hypothetical protein